MNGLAAAAIALVAGAEAGLALRLGLAMTALQLAIGATNDLVDAERDGAAGRRKPLPLGLIGRGSATMLAAGAAIGGLGLAASIGPLVAGLAAVGLAVGLAYDLRLRRLGLGWLAFVVGLPLLVLYGWFGGAGAVGGPVILLALAASPAGFGLAIANGRRDVAADRSVGRTSLAVRLGPIGDRVAVLAYAIALGPVLAGLLVWGGGGTGLGLVAAGIGVLAVGLRLPAAARAWEVQAMGLALVAVGWLAALQATGSI